MIGDLVGPTLEGTPYGGPLSPLLSNIVLDELDKELEKRGLRFVRYTDDFVVYVRGKKAAERVMQSATMFIERRLRLKVNQEKSVVSHPSHLKALLTGCARKGAWRMRKVKWVVIAMPNAYFDKLGLFLPGPRSA